MIELISLDVDGCLTDGYITYSDRGDQVKNFNVKDGLAIKTWQDMGKHVCIITGKESKIVERRAKELGIKYVFQGIRNKKEILSFVLDELGLEFKNVAAIGDDLNDYKLLEVVGFSFTPQDGSAYVKNIADVILERNGGKGCVREMIEYIVKNEGLEEDFLKSWI